MNLVKELNKEKQKTLNNSIEVITEASRLLESGTDKDKEILRNTGLSHQAIQYESSKKSTYLERKALDEKWEKDVFTEAELKEICCTYGFRLLRARYYQGSVASFVPQKIAEFCEKNNISTGTNLESQTYIMAPDNCFQLEDAEPWITMRKIDPIIFYKVDTGVYKMIAKWGKDITVWNFIKSIRRKNRSNYILLSLLYLWITLLLVASFLNPQSIVANLFITLGITLLSFFGLSALFSVDYDRCVREERWNNRYKLSGI